MIVELAEALGTQLVVTLGALLADVPHTRADLGHRPGLGPGLVTRLGLQNSSYEGPTGIVGVLHAACQQAGLPSASLWAAVPHYIAAAPNPKASLALVRKLEGLVGVAVDASELEIGLGRLRAPGQPGRAVATPTSRPSSSGSSRPRAQMTRTRPGPLPSGETIARDLQRFLRQRGDDTPPTAGGDPRRRLRQPRPGRPGAGGSALGRGTNQPVVAERARGKRRRGLKSLGQDPLGDLHGHLANPLRARCRRRRAPTTFWSSSR